MLTVRFPPCRRKF